MPAQREAVPAGQLGQQAPVGRRIQHVRWQRGQVPRKVVGLRDGLRAAKIERGIAEHIHHRGAGYFLLRLRIGHREGVRRDGRIQGFLPGRAQRGCALDDDRDPARVGSVHQNPLRQLARHTQQFVAVGLWSAGAQHAQRLAGVVECDGAHIAMRKAAARMQLPPSAILRQRARGLASGWQQQQHGIVTGQGAGSGNTRLRGQAWRAFARQQRRVGHGGVCLTEQG